MYGTLVGKWGDEAHNKAVLAAAGFAEIEAKTFEITLEGTVSPSCASLRGRVLMLFNTRTSWKTRSRALRRHSGAPTARRPSPCSPTA